MVRKFIRFDEERVLNHKGEHLGDTDYDKRWHCHVFIPNEGIQFSAGCMLEIVNYLIKCDQNKVDKRAKL